MTLVVHLDGRFLEDPEGAAVPLLDRGYLLGDSVFETLRAYEGVPFALEAHLERLARGAAHLGIALPCALDALGRTAREAARREGSREGQLRITLGRGPGPSALGARGFERPSLSVIARPLAGYPASAFEVGVETRVVGPRRIPAACVDPSYKSGAHYLPALLARRELEADALLEGVQLAVDGQVAGGTASNLFAVVGERLVTPWRASGCLPGVTRALLLELAPALGLTPTEERVEVAALESADELFFSGSLMECLPIASLGGRALGAAPGPTTRALHAALRARIAREVGARGDR